MKCKFCGCTDDRPCQLPIDIEGNFLAIANPKTTIEFVPCAWLIPGVCSAPACVEKAYIAVNPFAVMGEGRIVA